MPDILTPEEVAECRERAERATEGPWVVRTAPHPDSGETKAEYMASLVTDDCGSLFVIIPESDDDLPVEKRYRVTSIVGDAEQSPPNARFIAHARTDIPVLCATVEALLKVVEWQCRTKCAGYSSECTDRCRAAQVFRARELSR